MNSYQARGIVLSGDACFLILLNFCVRHLGESSAGICEATMNDDNGEYSVKVQHGQEAGVQGLLRPPKQNVFW